jgi:hypothetical protein
MIRPFSRATASAPRTRRRTDTGHAGEKVGAARLRSRAAISSAIHSGACAPLPTYTRAPTILRTMWCRKALARKSKTRQSPSRRTWPAAASSPATWPGTRRRERRKSRAHPSSSAAAGAHGHDIERQVEPADLAVRAAPAARRGCRARSDSCASAPRSAHGNRPAPARPAHGDAVRQVAFTPRTQAFSGRAAGASKCATCAAACTPASVRPAQATRTGAPAISPAHAPGILHGIARGWVCQPAKAAPSYSRPSAILTTGCSDEGHCGKSQSRQDGDVGGAQRLRLEDQSAAARQHPPLPAAIPANAGRGAPARHNASPASAAARRGGGPVPARRAARSGHAVPTRALPRR